MRKINIKKAYPALAIAIPLLTVAAFSSANGGYFASIASAGYGGTDQNCPMVSSMTLTPSSKTVMPNEHIDFNGRGFGVEEDVNVYLDGVSFAKAHADGGGNFTTGSLTLPATAGTYTFSFVGVRCNTPVYSTITVSTTGSNNGGSTTPTNPGTTPATGASINPSSATLAPGSHLDFNGRNFTHEQDVMVSLNGTQVGTAHADGGGNFTTGSMTAPMTAGTYTYTFTQASGTSLTSTITIQ